MYLKIQVMGTVLKEAVSLTHKRENLCYDQGYYNANEFSKKNQMASPPS